MLFLKKLGKSLLYSLISFFFLTFILTLFNYVGFIKFKAVSIIEIIILFLSIFIGSFIMGKSSNKKGWLEGIKFALIIIAIIFLFNFLGFDSFKVQNLLYYVIIMSSSILGSMIGINLKRDS